MVGCLLDTWRFPLFRYGTSGSVQVIGWGGCQWRPISLDAIGDGIARDRACPCHVPCYGLPMCRYPRLPGMGHRSLDSPACCPRLRCRPLPPAPLQAPSLLDTNHVSTLPSLVPSKSIPHVMPGPSGSCRSLTRRVRISEVLKKNRGAESRNAAKAENPAGEIGEETGFTGSVVFPSRT